MKVIYIGYAMDRETCDYQFGSTVSGNNMQIGILKALNRFLYKDLSIITINPIAAYPRSNKIFIHKENIEIEENICAVKIPFLNLKYLKEFSIMFSVLNSLIKFYLRNRKVKDKIILTFNMNFHICLPVLIMSKIFKIKNICITADPPKDDNTDKKLSILFRILRVLNSRIYIKGIKSSNGLILLNKHQLDYFKVDKPYIVIEGGVDEIELEKSEGSLFDEKKFNVVYTGSLNEYSGILNVIEEFELMNNDKINVYIFGKGPLEEVIIKKSSTINNVIFMGFVPNKIARKAQRDANLIICPYISNHSINKTAFPSKILEYMLSGTPVISTRISGLTDEYMPYLYFYDEKPRGLLTTINTIMNIPKDERESKGCDARKFILKNKTWEYQGKKIYCFVKSEV